jgi:hypothetical protein
MLHGGQVAGAGLLNVENRHPNDRVAVEFARRVQVLLLEPVAKYKDQFAQVGHEVHVHLDQFAVLTCKAFS